MNIAAVASGSSRRLFGSNGIHLERAAAVFGMLGIVVLAASSAIDAWDDGAGQGLTAVALETAGGSKAGAAPGAGAGGTAIATRETFAGGYLGVSYTHPSTVTIKNPSGGTDMTVGGVDWIGMPFKSPIYYGARISHWPGSSRVGAMLDFTHAKAIAPFEDEVTYSGTLNGKPLPPRGKVTDIFKHLEFSHGHNMLTLNALTRLGVFRVQPYVGAGAGISLPHTEIGYRGEQGRTYEYQYAGLVGQALAGLEIRVGNASIFLEYKISYAPYDVPLSGVDGWLLVTDLWRQTKAWAIGEKPPGGRLTTPLLSHHGIGGVMVRVAGARAAVAH